MFNDLLTVNEAPHKRNTRYKAIPMRQNNVIFSAILLHELFFFRTFAQKTTYYHTSTISVWKYLNNR